MSELIAILCLGAAAAATVFLLGLVALAIKNEREMQRLRKQGHLVLPLALFSYRVVTPTPIAKPRPWSDK